MSELCEADDPAAAALAAHGPRVASVDELLMNSSSIDSDPASPRLLSPIDLQVVKAAGVTFPVSMLERVIEEKALGDPHGADGVRRSILTALGTDLSGLVPGSPRALKLKEYLVGEGMWSAYLEVGIGPDAEIFTKAPVLSTVGTATEVGIRSDSEWNNPEPEVVLVVSSTRSHRGREPRKRRQPQGHRGSLRTPSRTGQGQQRVGRGGTVHPAVRQPVRSGAPRARDRLPARGGRRRIRPGGRLAALGDQQVPAGSGRPDHRAAPSVSRRLRPLPRHDVRSRPTTGAHRARASPIIRTTSSGSRRRPSAAW